MLNLSSIPGENLFAYHTKGSDEDKQNLIALTEAAMKEKGAHPRTLLRGRMLVEDLAYMFSPKNSSCLSHHIVLNYDQQRYVFLSACILESTKAKEHEEIINRVNSYSKEELNDTYRRYLSKWAVDGDVPLEVKYIDLLKGTSIKKIVLQMKQSDDFYDKFLLILVI